MEYIATWERDWLKEGIAKKAKEVAKKMLTDGLDIETIVDYSGLSRKEVENLMPKPK